VTALPFPNHSFDVVFSCSVLQYVDQRRTLAECNRVLRPDCYGACLLMGHATA